MYIGQCAMGQELKRYVDKHSLYMAWRLVFVRALRLRCVAVLGACSSVPMTRPSARECVCLNRFPNVL